jgi:hypothetical protein
MIFHTALYFDYHSSNVREDQILFEEIIVLHTLLSFEGIVTYNSPLN